MSDTPKKTFGKYEAISHLGSGAMGVVWRAQDPVLGRTVAIKTISASLGSDNENKERFLREARAAAQLNHPNIITVFDFGQADNELYMAMELLEGKDLKELITGGQLTFDQKLDIMEQVADGLAYAHGREVIHRDLKPGNIHVQPNGQVKILDFGLARLGSSDLTKTGVVMGTPNYMSPEQVMGERVDARSDVFSAGAVFYELLTNRKPFDAESVHATLYQVVHRDAPPPRQWDPRLPDEIVAIIETAMSKQVDGRYKNAGSLRDAIRAFRYGEDPEVVEYEESSDSAPETPAADATAIAQAPAVTSVTGAQKQAPFKSYGRSSSGSVPPSAGISSAPYTTGRVGRSGSRPPNRPSGGGDPRSASASIPPPQKQTNPVLVVGVLGVLVIGGFLAYGVLNRGNGNNAAQSSIDALTANLVETQLDLARRVLDDKDYKGAIDQTARILKLDPNNPEALGIREQAQSAQREIETSVAAARDAVARGDSAQASSALERVMARDPKNPIVAELSSKLNANFSARATEAKGEMEKAKIAADAKEGASLDTAYSEAKKFSDAADTSLKDRQFTAATQTFLQARDAYDRARRAIESKEREAARTTRTTTPTPATASTVAALPGPTTLPTLTLRPIPSETVAPVATPAPTIAIPVQTPQTQPTVAAAIPELREFVTARTRIAAAAETSGAKQPKGFDMSGVALLEFTGRFEFEVTPSPLIPGQPFRVRIFLKNEGKRDAKLDTLTAKIGRNGEVTAPQIRILEDNVKVDQRPMVAEVPGSWVAGTKTWVMDVEAMSKKGERFRSSLTMKP